MAENPYQPLENELRKSPAERMPAQAIVGMGLLLSFVVPAAVYTACRAAVILGLYQRGIRRDAILLLTVRDVSLAIMVLCGGFLLSSLTCNWARARRFAATVVLISCLCAFALTATAERRLRTQVQNNLEQLRSAIESYQLKENAARSRAVRETLENHPMPSVSNMELEFDSDGNPIWNKIIGEEFVDLAFRVSELDDDGINYRFHLSASYKTSNVGLNVVLAKGIESGFDSKMDLIKAHVYRRGVRFLRSGEDSDRLISAINELYGFEPIPCRMVDEESFTAIALHQGPLDLESECVRIKLFGKDAETFDEDDYYESFFNVDFANELVYWNEKDSDYRESLLRALIAR